MRVWTIVYAFARPQTCLAWAYKIFVWCKIVIAFLDAKLASLPRCETYFIYRRPACFLPNYLCEMRKNLFYDSNLSAIIIYNLESGLKTHFQFHGILPYSRLKYLRIDLDGECQIIFLIAQLSLQFIRIQFCLRNYMTRHGMKWHDKIDEIKGHSFNGMQTTQFITFILTFFVSVWTKINKKQIVSFFLKWMLNDMVRFVRRTNMIAT